MQDSSRPKSVVEPTNNENSSPGVNWRQQMSQRRQSYVPPKGEFQYRNKFSPSPMCSWKRF